ncbi:MAG: glycerol-3-phosphate 1-O-acyltransferase PlsY [Verrucomicrobia bacterium]|jgi:glycerol-3-phosphate acyltransferase PlsY|nr:glycerol-3-phosphate 1-O-acyltransferase PlsY [Verrucomicrobiota bacterium]
MLGYIFTAVAAYLLGSIPTGYLVVAKARGLDIRTAGSGNIGATNVFRILGKPAGICVLLLDALKGFGAVALILNYYHDLNEFLPRMFPVEAIAFPEVRLGYAILAGACAVVGHNYTCWIGFKGGKGIATSAGVYFALAPLAASIALGVWILLFVVSRYVSIASIAAAVALPTAVWFTTNSLCLGVFTTALGALAVYKHKANIQRLLAGTENRVHFKKEKIAT